MAASGGIQDILERLRGECDMSEGVCATLCGVLRMTFPHLARRRTSKSPTPSRRGEGGAGREDAACRLREGHARVERHTRGQGPGHGERPGAPPGLSVVHDFHIAIEVNMVP